jgi:cytidylate kinase
MAYAVLSDRGDEPWEALTEDDLRNLPLSLHPLEGGFEIRLGGRPLGPELRTPEVTSQASRLASLPAVRAALLGLQRTAADSGGLVADGRDMGAVVFPDAGVKVFLVADLGERARRRYLERTGAEPRPDDVRIEAEAIAERDRRDSQREHAPLRKPEGALELDTTRLSFGEQVDAVVDLATRKLAGEDPDR